jgi:hypothetical protein
MMHDPFQTYQALQYGSPYQTLQNPLAQLNPLAGINPYQQHTGGISSFAGIPPQLLLQLAALASQGGHQWGQSPYSGFQNPMLGGILQNPQALQSLHTTGLQQNPLLASILQNPMALQGLQSQGLQQNPLLQNPYLQQALLQNPLLAQSIGYGGSGYGQQFGQQHSPFQQLGQFGQGIPPQTWIGQGGQFGGRPFGTSPWGF